MLLFLLITDVSSFIHEALPAKNIGFSKKLLKVLINHSANTAPSSV